MNNSRQPTIKSPLTVLIVDNNSVAMHGLRDYLENHADFCVIGHAANAIEALLKTRQMFPDIVVSNVALPDVDGFRLSLVLRKENPHMKVVLVSDQNPTQITEQIATSGIGHYLSKTSQPSDLLNALEIDWQKGPAYIPEITAAPSMNRQAPAAITPRERDVLVCIAEGLANKEIAARLGLGVRTIEAHRDRICRKLNIHGVAGLTVFALRNNLISLDNAA
ncbi:MAG: hypothetical protein C5B50_06765 [Verrucomicrobia bacterium]|nr:MAG: hypothetical protein C5B50_06765 [Verrucomicrobiota bacterium]